MINILPISLPIPDNVIINADDFGLKPSINEAVLFCFEHKIINSTSLLTNTNYFESTLRLINDHPVINKIGIHVNLAEGKPVSDFKYDSYLDSQGNWDIKRIGKSTRFLSREMQRAFSEEINAQIEKALSAKIPINHIDSHYHLHTLPCFYKLFLQAAIRYNIKIRLAQTYRERSYIKYLYRMYINTSFKANELNYSDYFENVDHYLSTVNGTINAFNGTVEIMLHPDFDSKGNLTDHYNHQSIAKWLSFLNKVNV